MNKVLIADLLLGAQKLGAPESRRLAKVHLSTLVFAKALLSLGFTICVIFIVSLSRWLSTTRPTAGHDLPLPSSLSILARAIMTTKPAIRSTGMPAKEWLRLAATRVRLIDSESEPANG